MAVSPNYGWSEPDNSSLVKNGAQAMRTLGDAIDTSVWNIGFGQAGKNKIINGDFLINQRAFTSSTSAVYGFDRWVSGLTGGTVTYSAQTFTPGAAPVAGYEAVNFARLVTSGQSATGDYAFLGQRIENCRTFANQTVTVSFWAKANSGTPKVGVCVEQALGASFVQTPAGNPTITTSWARYSVTVAVPSLTGKTLGASNATSLNLYLFTSAGSGLSAYVGSLGVQNTTIDFWGVQIEYGSKATPFQTASGGSSQAELAMCQRYYQVVGEGANVFPIASGYVSAAGQYLRYPISFPVEFRTTPTATKNGTWTVSNAAQPQIGMISAKGWTFQLESTASGIILSHPNSTDDTITFSAEL